MSIETIDRWLTWEVLNLTNDDLFCVIAEGDHDPEDALEYIEVFRDDGVCFNADDGQTAREEWKHIKVKLLVFEPHEDFHHLAEECPGSVYLMHDSGTLHTVVYDPKWGHKLCETPFEAVRMWSKRNPRKQLPDEFTVLKD